MKSTRTKVIIGLVAVMTAGSLFAFKGKMMHHKKANMEHCQKMKSKDGKMKHQEHHRHFKFDKKKESHEVN